MKKLTFLLFFIFAAVAIGEDNVTIPTVNLSLSAPTTPTQLVSSLNVLLVLTVLTLAPSLVFMMTSFLRLIIVFSFLIMEPVGKQAYEAGVRPYLGEQIGYQEAFERGVKPFREFMIKNTREKDLALFLRIRNMPNPQSFDDIPLTVVMSAFMISEMKTAFEIAFLLYLPFLVIDMVVSSVLMAMGMMMLPPTMISLPFKLLIFILVDGWNLLVMNLVKSFH